MTHPPYGATQNNAPLSSCALDQYYFSQSESGGQGRLDNSIVETRGAQSIRDGMGRLVMREEDGKLRCDEEGEVA